MCPGSPPPGVLGTVYGPWEVRGRLGSAPHPAMTRLQWGPVEWTVLTAPHLSPILHKLRDLRSKQRMAGTMPPMVHHGHNLGPMGASRAKLKVLWSATDPVGTSTMVLLQGCRPEDRVVCAGDLNYKTGQVRRPLTQRWIWHWCCHQCWLSRVCGRALLPGRSRRGSSAGEGRTEMPRGPERRVELQYGSSNSSVGNNHDGGQACGGPHMAVQSVPGVWTLPAKVMAAMVPEQ